MISLFYGKEDFLLEQHLKKLIAGFAGADMATAQMNIQQLDGGTLSVNDFVGALQVVPFLADRRLVIVKGLLGRFEPRQGAGKGADEDAPAEEKPARGKKAAAKSGRDALSEGFLQGLRSVPSSTHAMLVEPRDLSERNPLLKELRGFDKKQFEQREFKPLHGDEAVSDWIMHESHTRGGKMEPEAALALASAVGTNLRMLDHELEKLLTYATQRKVTVADVQALVSEAKGGDVFGMVDAVGGRDRAAALRMLHELLNDGAAPLYLLAMITRQIRMLIQIKELSGGGLSSETIRSKTGIHPFVIKKVETQARRFTMKQLEQIYCRLLEADAAVKTGRSEPVLALDLLVAELTK